MTELDTTVALHDVIGKAKAMLLAKSRFDRAWLYYWVNHVAPCDEPTFFHLLQVYRKLVDKFVFGYKRGDVGVTHASREFFRQICTGEASWTWEDACGFVKFYKKLHDQLEAAIAHLFDYHGDGFADLCDSLPLAGEEVVRRCLASHPQSDRPRREGFLDESELIQAVKAVGPQWDQFVLKGENYVVGSLESACKQYWLHELLVDREGKQAWTEQEQRELAHADSGDTLQ